MFVLLPGEVVVPMHRIVISLYGNVLRGFPEEDDEAGEAPLDLPDLDVPFPRGDPFEPVTPIDAERAPNVLRNGDLPLARYLGRGDLGHSLLVVRIAILHGSVNRSQRRRHQALARTQERL